MLLNLARALATEYVSLSSEALLSRFCHLNSLSLLFSLRLHRVRVAVRLLRHPELRPLRQGPRAAAL